MENCQESGPSPELLTVLALLLPVVGVVIETLHACLLTYLTLAEVWTVFCVWGFYFRLAMSLFRVPVGYPFFLILFSSSYTP